MSVPFRPGRPAFTSFRPAFPAFVPAAPAIAAELATLTGTDGAVLRMDTGLALGDGRGYYHAGPLFLKAVDADRVMHQIEAERVAAWVASLGVRANTALPGYPRPWRAALSVFAYPWVEARFARTDPADLAALGGALAGLHRALADLPFANAVAASWRHRHAALEEVRRAVAAGTLAAGPDPEALRSRLAGLRLDLEGPAQPVHNDLHYANVLFPLNGSSPVLLDFEDARNSCLPPVVDVAKVLERFVLLPVGEDVAAMDLGKAFLTAYAAAGGAPPGHSGNLAEALRVQAARSLCDLVALSAAGQASEEAEWRKFFHLLDLVDRRGAVLDALDRAWRAA